MAGSVILASREGISTMKDKQVIDPMKEFYYSNAENEESDPDHHIEMEFQDDDEVSLFNKMFTIEHNSDESFATKMHSLANSLLYPADQQ